MKTTITLALAALLALAAHAPAQTPDDVWQMLVEAEVALTIEDDVERAAALVSKAETRAADFADAAQRERIAERIAELRVMIEQAREDDAEPSLDEWIVEKLRNTHYQQSAIAISQAGAPAIQRLAEMVAERTLVRVYGDMTLESDALDVIQRASPATAVDLAHRLLQRGDPVDVQLAARLVSSYLQKGEVAVGARDGTRRWVDLRWRDALIDLLARVTPSDRNAAHAVAESVERTIFIPVVDAQLVEAIVDALPRLPDQRPQLIGRRATRTPPEMAAVDVALLEIGTPDDQAFAAERLAFRDDATSLAAYDEHTDPRVRREVARSMTTRQLPDRRTLVPPYTARQRAALARLVTDDDVRTRALAARGATGAPDALTRERWLELARDPELDVRLEVAQFPFGHEWTRDVLVALIEASDEPAVALAVDSRLRRDGLDVAPLDVIDARVAHTTQPMAATSPDNATRARNALLRDIPQFIRWYLDADEERTQRYLDLATTTTVRNFWLRAVDSAGVVPADLEAFQRKVWSASDGVRTAVDLAAHPRAALRLALDESLPWSWRWQAIDAVRQSGSDALTDSERETLFTAIVSDPASADSAPLDNLYWVMPHRSRNAMILDAWTSDGPPEHPLLAASVSSFDEDGPRAVELAERLVGFGDRISEELRMSAIATLVRDGRAPDALVDEALLNATSGEVVEQVAEYASGVADPGRFESVRSLLTGDEGTRGISGADSRARTLVSFLAYHGTRAALDLLLTAAESGPTLSVREDALGAARKIRQHLDAVERFGAQAATPATRETARAELLVLLDTGSPAQRAQAARGLATLGAVEELPRLIRLLDDDDAQVVSAVREAIDRLHASGDG